MQKVWKVPTWAAALVTLLCLCVLSACGGGGSSTTPPPSPVSITISPATANILVATGANFSATVSGHSNTAFTYSVREGTAGGNVLPTGEYLAPTTPGTYHVRATSAADSSKYAEAVVTVRDYAKRFDLTSNPPDGFDYHTTNLLADGSVLIVGGRGLNNIHQLAYRYVPAENKYATDGSLTTARMAHASFSLPDGRVIIAGGYNPLLPGDDFDPVFTSSELYDPATKTFSAGPDMNFPRRHHVTTQLKDSRVLVTGGIQLRGSGFGASTNTEIYDPATGKFTAANTMNEGRWLHTATLLPDGRVLIVGGRNNNCTGNCPVYSLSSAEIYDPATGNFTTTGSLHISRFNHTATLLTNGKVLVLGGQSTDDLGGQTDQVATAEIYDPATGQFTLAGNLVLARSGHTVTLLNNGKLLLAGGWKISGVATQNTEIFDPGTGTSQEGPQMTEAHVRHTAVRLPGGEVLVVSGSNGYQPIPVAEIFR
ncbi:MAG TPA: kelch repeat-containing protein [Terriglobales bacterium]|nr:kelch repeat-containing protein [Terriglobales bacterium]